MNREACRRSEERIRRNRIRRERELKRHMVTAGVVLSMGLFLMFFALCGVRSDAMESGEEVLYKYYKSVVVMPCDTVETLAEDGVTGEEIRSINHITDDSEPLAGTTIIVPYYSTVFSG